jgi:hypothetical protein
VGGRRKKGVDGEKNNKIRRPFQKFSLSLQQKLKMAVSSTVTAFGDEKEKTLGFMLVDELGIKHQMFTAVPFPLTAILQSSGVRRSTVTFCIIFEERL